MRWITYLMLGYLVLGIQVGFAGFVDVGGAAPNLVLLAAVFVALNAPREPALMGCLMLGIMQDLLTQQTLGMHAFSYGLVAMFVISTQAIVYREHPLTHMSLAAAGMTVVSFVMVIQGWLWFDKSSRLSPLSLMYATLYTILVAPLMLGMLEKVKFLFGFQPIRRGRV